MRGTLLTVAAIAVSLATRCAFGDALVLAKGARLEGRVETVSFLVGDVPTMCARSQTEAVQLSATGEDILVLKGGRKRVGKLMSVRFVADGRSRRYTRKALEAIELSEKAPPPARKPTRKPEPDGKKEPPLSPEQQDAMAASKRLYKAHSLKAGKMRLDEIERLASQHKERWDWLNASIKGHQAEAAAKMKARADAEALNDGKRLAALKRSDGLALELRRIAERRSEKKRLESLLKSKRKLLDARAKLRAAALKAAYDGIARDIVEGKTVSEEDMAKRYAAALAEDPLAKT